MELTAAAFLLPPTKLVRFTIPMRATILTRMTMMGVLFFNGETASGCSETVAGWF
jgi:hypothetical protein